MPSSIADPRLAQALDDVDGSLASLAAVGAVPADGRDAYGVIRRVEAIANRVYGLQVGLLADIDRRGLFTEDGHRTGKAMVSYAANLSPASATQRAKTARALASLPATAAALAAGTLGIAQADRIARAWSNPRVRAELEAAEHHLVVVAERLPYREFDAHLANWERLTDEDGAEDRAERNHRTRRFTITRNADGSYRFDGGCGGMQGTVTKAVYDRFLQAERDADWAEAQARLGTAATFDDLARTDSQRSMDAVEAIFRAAAQQLAADPGAVPIVTNVVVDLTTFERGVRAMAGLPVELDPRVATWWSDLAGDLGADQADQPDRPAEPVGYRCGTVDGHPLDPREVVAASFLGHVRRVVIGSDSVVLDMGRKQRLFTGARQTAVHLSHDHCYWLGCPVPSTRCQSDHLAEFNGPRRGRTEPSNGAPACGPHNRHKTTAGFTVTRDRRGRIHILRPDGSRVP